MDQSVAIIKITDGLNSRIKLLTVFIGVAYKNIDYTIIYIVIFKQCYVPNLYNIDETIYGWTILRRRGNDSLNT